MINEFRGEYDFLSNFVDCPIEMDGWVYKSVEHAYQSMKSHDKQWKTYCCDQTNSASDIKVKSKKINIRKDWDSVKYDIMKVCLIQKYNIEPFRSKLIDTGDDFIMEGNWWGDVYWGVDLKTNKGENNLGKIIMEIRDNLNINLYYNFFE